MYTKRSIRKSSHGILNTVCKNERFHVEDEDMNHEAEQQSKQWQTTCLSGPIVAYGGLQGSKLG